MGQVQNIESYTFSTNQVLEEGKNELLLKIKELESLDSNNSQKYLQDINNDFSSLIADGNISIYDTINLSKKIHGLILTVEKDIAEKQFNVFGESLDFNGLIGKFSTLKQNLETKLSNTTFIREKVHLNGDINQIEQLIEKIEKLNVSLNGERNKKKKKEVFDSLIKFSKKFYLELAGNSNFTVMKGLLEDIEKFGLKYNREKERIKKDSKLEQSIIIQDKFLQDVDIIGFSHISEKLDESRNFNLNELMQEAKKIELSGEIEGQSAWNDFFADLRDHVPDTSLEEFDKEVAEFEKQFDYLYEEKIDTGKIGAALNSYLTGIEGGKYDKLFEKGQFKIRVSFNSFLHNITGLNIPGGDNLEIGPFVSKEEAVRTIYKLKLIFEQVESSGSNLIAMYYSMIGSGFSYGMESAYGNLTNIGHDFGDMFGIDYEDGNWTHLPLSLPGNVITGVSVLVLTSILSLVASVAPVGIPAFFMGAALESFKRRSVDFLARRFGDRGVARPVRSISTGIGKLTGFFGRQAIDGAKGIKNSPFKSIANIMKLTTAGSMWVGMQPINLAFGTTAYLLENSEQTHLDASNALANRENIMLIDGLRSGSTGMTGLDEATSNDAIELRSRLKILALAMKQAEYEGDLKKLEKLEEISKKSLWSNTESFYIDIDNVNNLDYGKSKTKKIADSAWQIITLQFKKEQVSIEYKKNMENIKNLLSVIYEGIGYEDGDGKITIPENEKYTSFFTNLKSNIDFGLIDNNQEIELEKLLNELILEVKKGGVGNIKPDELKVEIQKIVNGYLPKFKMISLIVDKRKQLASNETALEKLEEFRRMVIAGDWYGDKLEFENILNDIETTTLEENKPSMKSIDDLKKEGERLVKLDLRKQANFNDIININSYNKDLGVVGLLIDMGEITGTSEQSIKRELSYLFNDIKSTTKALDYSLPELNFAISSILEGKKYNQRGDGTFGKSITLDQIIKDYSEFDINVSDKNTEKLLNKLSTLNFDEKLEIIENIEKNNDFTDIKRNSAYKTIVKDFEIELKLKNTDFGNDIKDLSKQLNNLFKEVNFIEDNGESDNLKSSRDELRKEIRILLNNFNELSNYGTSIIDKILFYKNAQSKITLIDGKIRELGTDVSDYKNKPQEDAPKSTVDVDDSLNTEKKENLKKGIKKLDRLYEYAIIKAELDGDFDKATDLLKMKIQKLKDVLERGNINFDNEKTALESFFGEQLYFGENKLRDLKSNLKEIKGLVNDVLIKENILSVVDGKYEVNGDIDKLRNRLLELNNPSLDKYVDSLIKKGI